MTAPEQARQLMDRLRGSVQTLRRTPMPIADVAPMQTQAADCIESLLAQIETMQKKYEALSQAYGLMHGRSK